MTSLLNFMSIGKHVFPVENAVLAANLGSTGFYWQVRVWAKGDLGVHKIDPYAYSENLLPIYNKCFRKWQDVLSEEISWEECYSETYEKSNACLRIFSHDDIDNGVIQFSEVSGLGLRIDWSGVVETSAAEAFEDHDDDIGFLCRADMSFLGITVRGIERDEAIPRIREFITEQEFFFSEMRGDGALVFLPR